ncbi:MAG: hypothetical protein ACI4XH_08815, partial [Acutalibacteraceae bacterium]
MSTIKVKTADQKLFITDKPLISSGDKDSDFIEFDFDSSWDEFTERYCVFYLDRPDPYQVAIENGKCPIIEAMTAQEGVFYFGIWGRALNVNQIKTSEIVAYKIATGAPTDGITMSTWDSFWSNLISGSNLFKDRKIEPNPPAFQTYNMTSAEYMFQSTKVENLTISVNKASSLRSFTQYCSYLKTVTFLDISNAMTSLEAAFSFCPKLERINGEIDMTNFSNRGLWSAFEKCSSLEYLRIKPNTRSYKIDMTDCSALSRESVISVLESSCEITETQIDKFNSAVYSSDLDSYIMAAV